MSEKFHSSSQRQAARQNIKKAQDAWQHKSPPARARAQPEGRGRAKSGATGAGEYYHVEVRPKEQFVTFRTHDVGKKGGIERVAGRRRSGSWADQTWLISKDQAHVEDSKLIPDTEAARDVLDALGSVPMHSQGDRFTAKPRPNIPEEAKPTPAQRKAQQSNIKKAQAARRATQPHL
jgi:hypothetical protein